MRLFPVFLACLTVLSQHRGAPPPDSGLNRTLRGAPCRPGVEYRHGNLCCLHCRAGTYVKSHCSRSGEAGQCEECDSGTFTEHDNDLTKCLPCTQCRSSDQELVKQCTHAQDAKCQCKAGRFCHPDEACEVCKKCIRCKHDEEVVRNCTSTTNTECKKVQSKADTPAGVTVAIVVVVLLGVSVVVIIAVVIYKRRTSDSGPDSPDAVKPEWYSIAPAVRGEAETRRSSSTNLSLPRQLVRVRSTAGVEEERERLCESLTSSASNSQHSLAGPPAPAASPMPAPRAGLGTPGRPGRTEEEFPELTPAKGEESLRACFEYFEDLNMDYYRRFFRSLGISDNIIKGCEHQQYEDRIHELLNKWVEKKGRDADLNHLLRALLDLSQKLTAETIKDRALRDGHYFCEGR